MTDYSNTELIDTSQAPDAKPVGISFTAESDWNAIIIVPRYRIPEMTFGGGMIEVEGVAEIISPLVCANKTLYTQSISVRIYRSASSTYFYLAKEAMVPKNNVLYIPLNGQFLHSGDALEVKADTSDALDITLSYTIGQAEEDDVV